MKRTSKWAVGILGLGACVTAAGIAWFLFGRDQSVYSAGYDEARFQSLRIGMERSEVERLLGSPLQEQREPQLEAWWYGERGRPPGVLVVADPQVVKFGNDGLVSERNGPLVEKIEVGMSPADVLRVAGRPDRQTARSAVTVHYSMPGRTGLYRARIVTYDERGVVTRITTFSMRD